MFCYQCEETAGNKGCTKIGVCGKKDNTALLQDKLIYMVKRIAKEGKKYDKAGIGDERNRT